MCSAAACAEGDALPEPWQSFSLREFAAGLFDSDASTAQAHVRRRRRARARRSSASPRSPRATRSLIVLDDLTEQERRELAEREFVSNAAHELRTPLTTIIGAVEVLQAGAKEDPAERDRFLAHIEREAARLARLARALLTLARAHAGQERPRAEAVALARAAATRSPTRLRPLAGVAVEVDCPPTARDASTATCSSRRSATSARTPRSTRATGRIVLARLRAGYTVAVEVEDTGRRDEPPRRSSTSSTASTAARSATREGFGLGLAIVRRVGAQPRRPHRARLGRPARARACGSCSSRARARGGAAA